MLSKIHHVGIAVRNADQALGFYRDVLGMPVTKDEVIEDQGVRGVLLAAGEGEIELLEPIRADTGIARFLASRGEGLHHLCFATDDIEAELETARAKGLPLIDQTPRLGLAGRIAFLHPRATRGVLVEYAQPPGNGSKHDPIGGAGVHELDRVVVAVTDLDAGVQTYEQNFTLTERERWEQAHLNLRAAALPIGAALLELVAPVGDSGALAEFLKRRGEGMYLISLAVPSLDRAVQTLEAAGRPTTPPAVALGPPLAFVSPRLTNGVLIQLVGRQP